MESSKLLDSFSEIECDFLWWYDKIRIYSWPIWFSEKGSFHYIVWLKMTEYSATLCIVLFAYFSTLGNITINNYMDGRITDCTALLLYCIYCQPPECALCVFVCVCVCMCACVCLRSNQSVPKTPDYISELSKLIVCTPPFLLGGPNFQEMMLDRISHFWGALLRKTGLTFFRGEREEVVAVFTIKNLNKLWNFH